MPCLTLNVEVDGGARRDCVVREAIALSQRIGIPVSFSFNKVYVKVHGDSDAKEVSSAILDAIRVWINKDEE